MDTKDAKIQFGKDLKKRVLAKQSVVDIGCWVYTVYLDWPDCDDSKFSGFLLHLGTMELGPEFAFTYEELEKIAYKFIAGKDVVL